MPAPYTVVYNKKDKLTLDFEGQHIEVKKPGDTWTAKDACQMVRFHNAVVALGQAIGEETEGLYKQIQEECTQSNSGQVIDIFVTPAEPAPVEDPSTTGSDSPPPEGQETSQSLGAPQPSVFGTLDETPPGPGESDGRPLAEQYYRPVDPVPDYDVYAQLSSAGVPADQLEPSFLSVLHNEPPDGEPHPYFGRDFSPLSVMAADPVTVFTGQYTYTNTDIEIASRGFPLHLTRVYHSGQVYFGPWGYNWDHNYNVHLRELKDGSVAVWTGELNEDVYQRGPVPTFRSPVGVFRKLEWQAATANTPERYVLSDVMGMSQIFLRPDGWPLPDRIPLTSIEDRHGNAHVLSFDPEGRVSRVQDHAGRRINFTYGQCGLLEQVSDHTGRTWRYLHDAEIEHLSAVIAPSTQEFPEGLKTCYEYDRFRSHPALLHNMTRVIDPTGRVLVENRYGDEPDTDDFGRVVYQEYGGFEATYHAERLQYVPPTPDAANVPAVRVEVVDPGVLHVYTFNYRGDLLDDRFRLVLDGSYRLVARTYRYDSAGNRTEERKPNGLGIRYTYDHDNEDPRARANLLKAEFLAPPTKPAPSRILQLITYEPQFHRIKTSTDELGRVTTWMYDYEEGIGTSGDVIRIVYPDATLPDGTAQSRVERFAYNAFGQLIERQTGAGHRHVYAFSTGGPTEGYEISVTWDINGAAQQEAFEHDALGRRTALIDGLGARTEITYNSIGQITSVRLPEVSGKIDEFRYFHDAAGWVRREERPRGSYNDLVITDSFIANEFEYDAFGRLKRARYGVNTANPLEYRYERDGEGRVLSMSDAMGRLIWMSYDERGLLLFHTEAAGTAEAATWEYSYDRNGNRAALIDPAGHRFDYVYDAWDRLTRMTLPGSPESERTAIDFELNHQDRIKHLQMSGRTTPGNTGILLEVFTDFDERGRAWRWRADSRMMTLTHDADERVILRTDQRGNSVSLYYDGLDRVIKGVDPIGNSEIRSYDAAGNLVVIKTEDVLPDNAGVETFVTAVTYDARNRAIKAIDPLGRVFRSQYDARDFPIADIDPLGHPVTRTYGLRGELMSITAEESPGNNVTHRYTYDAGGRRTEYTDPEGGVTSFQYDARDRLTATIYPDGRTHHQFYDKRRQPAGEQTPGGTLKKYNYAPDAGLVGIDFTPGAGVAATPPLAITRDGLRRPVRFEQKGVVLDIGYDSALRVTSEAIAGQVVSLAHDDVLGTALLTYPDGRVDRITFDELWRPVSVTLQSVGTAALTGATAAGTELARNFYRGPERLARRELHNGLVMRLEYDGAQRLTALEQLNASLQRLVAVRYLYDAADRPRIVWAGPLPLAPLRCDYDNLSRLRFAAIDLPLAEPSGGLSQAAADAVIAAAEGLIPGRSESFDLNRADDRIARTVKDSSAQATETIAVSSAHQISQLTRVGNGAGIWPFVFDADGRCIKDETYQYTYNALGQLVEARDSATMAVILAQEFDPAGRVMHRAELSSDYSQWHLGYRLVERRSLAIPSVQFTYGIGIDELLLESDGKMRYPLQDANSNLLAYADENGVVLERYRYAPFGEASIWAPDGLTPRASSAADGVPRFGGHVLVSGALYDARMRVYDPHTGRFLQPDRLQYFDSPSLYVYAHHDPVGFVDPTGEVGILAGLLIAAGAGLLVGLGTNAVRQGILMHEDPLKEFDLSEMLWSGAAGAVLAPAMVLAPGLGVPLAGWGVAGGIDEMSQGHWETGTYDVALSVLPFAMKGGRSSIFGRGSLFSSAPEGLSARMARFGGIRARLVHATKGITRVIHVSDPVGMAGIERDMSIDAAKGRWAKFKTWVSPWRAPEMGPWRRSMSGYPFRSPYVEFDVRPGELSRPRGLKYLFSRWQRQIPGPIDLTGRNPKFGLLPVEPEAPRLGHIWPSAHLPRPKVPFHDWDWSGRSGIASISLDANIGGGSSTLK